MSKLKLSLAVGPYDCTRALIDGSVQIDGVETVGMTLSPLANKMARMGWAIMAKGERYREPVAVEA